MSDLVISAPMHFFSAPIHFFAPDRRRPWWRRLIQSLARRARTLAAERRRRRIIDRLRDFDHYRLVGVGA
jgi:hypothetical protein